MDRFIARENIKHYRDRLRTESDPPLRRQLQKLLIEEEDKLGADLELVGELERVIASFDTLIETQERLVAVLERDRLDGAGRARALLDGLTETQIVNKTYHLRVAGLVRRRPG